jgi:hypothetical protein
MALTEVFMSRSSKRSARPRRKSLKGNNFFTHDLAVGATTTGTFAAKLFRMCMPWASRVWKPTCIT